MPTVRLVEARWMRPHRGPRQVELRYADGSRRRVGLGGSLTVGEAAKLLNTYTIAVYRLADQKKIVIRNGRHGFSRVSVTSLATLGA